ncbi:hypothetical protein T492DRAFT_877303, partial [Pavlovales sp. CCMP2436]
MGCLAKLFSFFNQSFQRALALQPAPRTRERFYPFGSLPNSFGSLFNQSFHRAPALRPTPCTRKRRRQRFVFGFLIINNFYQLPTSAPARASRCIINIDSLPMLVPQAHSPSRTSCSTDTELLSLLVHQMLALPAPAHATDMLSLSAPSTPVHGHLLDTQIKLQIDLAVNSTLVSGHLLDTQIKLQIDLADITTLVSGHLLDTQIMLPIDLAKNSQKYIPRSPIEASTLSPCCPPEDIAHLPCLTEINALMPLNSLEANKLPPCLTEINALMPLKSLEANELPPCLTEVITLTPCCPLEVNTLPPLLPLEIKSLPLHQLKINSLPLLPPDNYSLCFRPPPSCPFEE